MPHHAESSALTSTRELRLDPCQHLKWARSIARGVCSDLGFPRGSHEEADLESVAYLALVELCHRYDESRLPLTGDIDGAFRGAYAVEIRSRCRREAERLRNGGLYYTTTGNPIQVEGLPVRAGGDYDLLAVDDEDE